MVLLRILFCLAVFTGPIVLLAIVGRRRGALWLLLFPMFGAIPATLTTLLVLWPIELLLDARGLGAIKPGVLPAVGSALIILFDMGMALWARWPGFVMRRIAHQPLQALGPLLPWMVAGAIWGGLWWWSGWLAQRIA